MVCPAAFQGTYGFIERLALPPVESQLMCTRIAPLLRDYSNHDKNCMVRASTVPLSVCPFAKNNAICFASELNSVSCDGDFWGLILSLKECFCILLTIMYLG